MADASALEQRVAALEQEVATLQQQVAALQTATLDARVRGPESGAVRAGPPISH